MEALINGSRLNVLLTGTSSDSHVWNLVYMHLFIQELGHDVRNLGCCTPDDLLLREAVRMAPDLVVLSTVNGHGLTDGARAVRLLRGEAPLREIPIVIGGKLGVAGSGRAEYARTLLAAGFTAVFGDEDIDVALFESFIDSVMKNRVTTRVSN
ncbi:cobalamin B12-binding domain-containing protein [Nonomuraea sp. LPB2021202275-12-8]|uniref:cobalamin B12-binding domain-containing protein n=1 Tax=Nonomuraea sp. LPB2021202275-12-8 TaxID=3120159 RepID=UPI00300C7113